MVFPGTYNANLTCKEKLSWGLSADPLVAILPSLEPGQWKQFSPESSAEVP